jgi:signal transduction histidine kinase
MLKPLSRLSVQTRTLLTFLVAVLVPALVLAAAGVRTMIQERAAADAALTNALNEEGQQAARELQRELDRWQQAMRDLPGGRVSLSSVPGFLRQALTVPGGAVVLRVNANDVVTDPPGQLLYLPSAGARLDPPLEVLAADTAAQGVSQDEAFAIYRRLLATTFAPSARGWVLSRLAGLAKAKGRDADARRAYTELGQLAGITLGAVPADLVGQWGFCSLLGRSGTPGERFDSARGFYNDLVNGRWLVDKSLYTFYSEQARSWLTRCPAGRAQEVATLVELEDRKRPLAEAIARLVSVWEPARGRPGILATADGPTLVFWHAADGVPPATALVIAPQYAVSSLLPGALSRVRPDLLVSLTTADGTRVSPASAAGRPVDPMSAQIRVQVLDSLWRLDIWPRDAGSLQANVQRSRRLYGWMLLLMVLSIAFGVITSARTLRKQLEVARLKSDFASAVSHELRSPLTGIRQAAEMLAAGRIPNEERRAEYYSMILAEVDRLTSMVENVLGFARLRGRDRLPREQVDMTSWLSEVVERFRRTPVGAGAVILAGIPVGLPNACIDREAFSRAIGNLLDNAIKYSPGERTVWIEADLDREMLVIRVRDRGIGIDPADQPHIFEAFHRGRHELVQEVTGSGLGLSLVKEVVDAHGADISVESRPGEGTVFIIRMAVNA